MTFLPCQFTFIKICIIIRFKIRIFFEIILRLWSDEAHAGRISEMNHLVLSDE